MYRIIQMISIKYSSTNDMVRRELDWICDQEGQNHCIP